MNIDPENRPAHAAQFGHYLGDYLSTTTFASTRAKLERIGNLALADEFYAGLRLCKELIVVEDNVLGRPLREVQVSP